MDGYKAGEGCLIEAKLWHVEEGHPTSWTECSSSANVQLEVKGPGRKSKMDAEGKEIKEDPTTRVHKQQLQLGVSLLDLSQVGEPWWRSSTAQAHLWL